MEQRFMMFGFVAVEFLMELLPRIKGNPSQVQGNKQKEKTAFKRE